MIPVKVYLDLDGTCLDWVGKITQMTGRTLSEINSEPGSLMIHKAYKDDPNFFSDLDLIEENLPLLELLKVLENRGVVQVFPLTSAGLFPCLKKAKSDKKKNFKERIDKVLGTNWSPRLTCIRGHDKGSFVTSPKDILIDDYHKPIADFISKGGIGCLIESDKRSECIIRFREALCAALDEESCTGELFYWEPKHLPTGSVVLEGRLKGIPYQSPAVIAFGNGIAYTYGGKSFSLEYTHEFDRKVSIVQKSLSTYGDKNVFR